VPKQQTMQELAHLTVLMTAVWDFLILHYGTY